jgi:membrane-bound ClpP family serine protease
MVVGPFHLHGYSVRMLLLACLMAVILQGAAPTAVPPSRAAKLVAVLPVRGEIDAITVESLTARAKRATLAGADAIVIELDTPGGEMLSTLELCRRIKGTFPSNTAAWIRPQAFSAGAITALACREIVVSPDAVLGDAAPIRVSMLGGLQALEPAERAKLEAPLLSEVTDSARRNGHDERLCRAFISAPLELWLLEDTERGERYLVDAEEYAAVFGEEPPRAGTASRPTAGSAVAAWITDALRRPAATGDDDASQRYLPGRAPLTAADRVRLRLVSRIDGADELLTLRAAEAVALGLARAEIADEAALRQHFGAQASFRLVPRWSEPVARVLTSGWLRALLVIALVACFVGEMLAPGIGVFSIGGLAAVGLLIVGPLLAGLAEWWPAIAMVAGLGLVALELLVFPGSLLAGSAGVLAFAGGTIGLFVASDPSPDPTRSMLQGLATLAGSVLAAFLMAWWLGRTRGGLAGLAVHEAQLATPSASATLPPVGSEGLTTTDLRPIGEVEIDGRVHQARANAWIERGSRVRVTAIEANELRVEALA